MTWLGGICMVPSARRSNDSTITIRVNEVSIIKMAGARERMVINKKICNTTAIFPGSWVWSMPMLIKGGAVCGAAATLFSGVKKIALKPIPRNTPINSSRCIHRSRLAPPETLRSRHTEIKLAPNGRFKSSGLDIIDRFYVP